MKLSNVLKNSTSIFLVAALTWLVFCIQLQLNLYYCVIPLILLGAALLTLQPIRSRSLTAKTQTTLVKEKEQLQLALDAARESLWDWRLSNGSNDIYFSKAYCEMLGYEQAEFAHSQTTWQHYLHPDERERIYQRVLQFFSEKNTYYENTYRMLHKDGSYRWIYARGHLFVDKQGRLQRFIGIATDITEQRQATERLRLAHAVFDSTHEGVLITDDKNQIIFINPAFTNITGYTSAEVLGKNPRLFQSGRHSREFYTELWKTLEKNDHWTGEVWNRRKNGEVLPQFQTIRVVRNEHGLTTHHVAVFSDISVLKNSQSELSLLAHYDPLTSLPNRLLLHEHIKLSLRRAIKKETDAALLMIDLDHFKTINESLGHSRGDELIKAIALRIKKSLENTEILSRFGGDEFGIVIDKVDSSNQAANFASNILSLFTQPFIIGDNPLFISASIGICLFPSAGSTAEEVFRNADTALNKAKASGRNTFAFYSSSLTEMAYRKLRTANELRYAIEQQQLEVYYQPVYSLSRRRIIGSEALVRWQHPENGLVPPNDFIPIAEDYNLIGSIDNWVLKQACQQMQTWKTAEYPLEFVAVNISSHLFNRKHKVKNAVMAALKHSLLTPDSLELEITESATMEDSRQAISIMHELRELGVRLAIDDFGTGYSSLGRLKYLPVDKFKIDQSFIRNLPNDQNDVAIVRAIIALSESMCLAVQAEGIETEEQSTLLSGLNCELGQGYLFGRPMPAAEFEQLVLQQQRELEHGSNA